MQRSGQSGRNTPNGCNLSGPFNVEDWADVQTLIFDLLTPEGISIDDDIYLR